MSADGKVYYVVSHTDVGAPNWMDTTELEKGQLTFRYIYEDAAPTDPALKPVLTVTKIYADSVWAHLPGDTVAVSDEERASEKKNVQNAAPP